MSRFRLSKTRMLELDLPEEVYTRIGERNGTKKTPHDWWHEQGSFATMQYFHCLLYWPGLMHFVTEVAQWKQSLRFALRSP
jgi:hypothetical protein